MNDRPDAFTPPRLIHNNAIFTDSRDPLTGRPGDANYHAVFDRIAGRLPTAPVVLRAES